MRSRSRLRRALAAAILLVVAASCSDGDALRSASPKPVQATTTVAVGPAGEGSCDEVAEGTIDGSALLECVGESVAFIETAAGSGSGLVVAGGYVVTNAHVVDPFGSVSVMFADGEVHEDVPVKGTDLVADIALVGPIEMDRAPLAMHDPADDEQGSDVFLLGYPGETNSGVPELTISRGILSRFREVEQFDLTFLQTDAAIGYGQSGGALIDHRGRVIGVSGLFNDEFAYALSGPNVQGSIDRIAGGDVSEYRSLPIADSSTTTSVHVDTPEVDEGLIVLPYSDTDTTVRLTVRSSAAPFFAVLDLLTGTPTFVSEGALELFGGDAESVAELDGAREVEPGVFEVDVPAETYLVAIFGAQTAPADVSLEASVPVFPVTDGDQSHPLAVGETVDAVMDYFESTDSYVLDLAEGEAVTINVSSPTGDMAYSVQAPGQSFVDASFVDDSDIGLFGYDAEDRLIASAAGTYVVRVANNDGYSTGYRITVTAD